MNSRVKSLFLPAVLVIALSLLLALPLIGCSPASSDTTGTESVDGATEGTDQGTGDAAGTNLANDPAMLAEELIIEDLAVGTGAEAKTGDTVAVHYTGWLTNGIQFDSSVDRGTPFSFTIDAGEVISGWDQGVAGMKVGGKRKLTIPPSMGYGDTARGMIPAGATLVFEVELLEVK